MRTRSATSVLGGLVLLCVVIVGLRVHDKATPDVVERRPNTAMERPRVAESQESVEREPSSIGRETTKPVSGRESLKTAVTNIPPSSEHAYTKKHDDAVIRHKRVWKAQLPDVGRVLGLHPEEYEQLLNVLAEFDLRLQDLSESSGERDTFEEEKKLYVERARTLHQFFGDARNQEWLQYLETTGIRAQIRRLESTVATTDPLTPDQRTALLDSLIDANRRYQLNEERRQRIKPRATPDVEALLRDYEQFRELMHHAAAPYLSSAQLSELDKIFQESQPRVEHLAPAF